MDRELLMRSHAVKEELLKRQADDGLKQFFPQKKQKPFVKAILEDRETMCMLFGANRCGKSDIGAYIDASLARHGHNDPKSNFSGSGKNFIEVRDRATSGWVVSLDFPSSRDIMQPKIFDNGFVPPGAHSPFIPQREIAENGWRITDQVLKLKNGSIIGFKSGDSGAKKFQGAGKDYIHFDEEPNYEIFEEATIRVEAGRRLAVFMTCTLLPPIGQAGGVTWSYDKFVKPWRKGENPHVKIFTSSIYDNPFIEKAELAYLEAMFPPGSRARRIRLNGELLPGLGGARAYAAFENELHVREQTVLHAHRPLCWMWDFNVEPMVTLVGQRDNLLFRFKGELSLEEGNIPDMCQLFYHRYGYFKGDIWIYGDATGQGRTSQYSQTDYTVIANELRRFGINFKLKVPLVNPIVTDRINAMNRAFKNELGLIGVEVDPSCTELIDDFEQVLLDPKGGIKKSHNRKETYYHRTHASDAAGYWITYEAPVKPLSIRQKLFRSIPGARYGR